MKMILANIMLLGDLGAQLRLHKAGIMGTLASSVMFVGSLICNMFLRYFSVSAQIWKQDLGDILGKACEGGRVRAVRKDAGLRGLRNAKLGHGSREVRARHLQEV